MSDPPAYTLFQEFEPAPPQVFQVDRHYLLYACRGAMRLEAEGRSWSLPPARAALIAAGHPVTVTLPQRVTACSALFEPSLVPPPPATLSVFEMTDLARTLIMETRRWGAGSGPLGDAARQIYLTLAQVTWDLSRRHSPAVVPVGRSDAVNRAVALTAERIAEDLRFEEIARSVAMTPRSLARRFADELGMTWSQLLRRQRIVAAIEHLARSDAAVTQIAYAVGYNSIAAFNAAFRDLTGTTPTRYRQSFRQAADDAQQSKD